eukprot:11142273-Alexandrium_andersonii.AAC.2
MTSSDEVTAFFFAHPNLLRGLAGHAPSEPVCKQTWPHSAGSRQSPRSQPAQSSSGYPLRCARPPCIRI